jgi:hypothetical protein
MTKRRHQNFAAILCCLLSPTILVDCGSTTTSGSGDAPRQTTWDRHDVGANEDYRGKCDSLCREGEYCLLAVTEGEFCGGACIPLPSGCSACDCLATHYVSPDYDCTAPELGCIESGNVPFVLPIIEYDQANSACPCWVYKCVPGCDG